MSTLALKHTTSTQWQLGWGIAASLVVFAAVHFGITMNQALAVMITAIILIIWAHSNSNGLIAAVIFFMVKPMFLRFAYGVDKGITGSAGTDLLGVTPALLLTGMIVWHLYLKIASGERIIFGRTRLLVVLFSAVAFISIFNPANTILVGLGGFERNILPNMMILFSSAFLFRTQDDITKLLKALLVLGVISVIYALGQYILGYYPWESEWLMDTVFTERNGSWFTIGLRGIEFRAFSVYYNYMDFTFSNSLIFALVAATGSILTGWWRKVRIWYMVLWFLLLIITVERMPLVMSLAGVGVIYLLRSSKSKRRKVLFYSTVTAVLLVVGLRIAEPYLKETGAGTLIRLAEMTNPFGAASIEDRFDRKWTPALTTIASNPMGVGIGHGSYSRANTIAEESRHWVDPHNEFLHKALETGIIGAILFLFLLMGVFKDGWKLSHISGISNEFGIGFLAGTIGFGLCGLVHVVLIGSPGILYWAVAGAVLGIKENEESALDVKSSSESADNSNS